MERDAIREKVFERDGNRCVVCPRHAVDAHHLLERRLWDDQGYTLDNMVSLCYDDHLDAERTVLSVEELRYRAGITTLVLPSQLYPDVSYDKWGNVRLDGKRRSPGELYWRPSVQEMLREGATILKHMGEVMDTVVPYVKYPRTFHLPWSNPSKGDRVMLTLEHLEGQQIVVTEKMDGENTTLYTAYLHARSIDSAKHPTRDWITRWWFQRAHDLPYNMRICGENLFAKHSIAYMQLPTFFMGFSVWEDDRCLSWDDTLTWLALFDVLPVPVLYEGLYEQCNFHALSYDNSGREGYVVRVRDSFTMSDFRKKVGKYVRPHHVTSGAHWSTHYEQNRLENT